MLDHTPREITPRGALKINPAKTCQPIGAMYAALGIHGCLPHSHGSQGCCSYHRSHLTRHFKEPIMAASSSFTEGASVFGGGANLSQALNNIFTVYNPQVIAVHTTCLSETIGDDIPSIIRNAKQKGDIPAGATVFHANTPSYVGSHVTGFANMVKGMVTYYAESSGKKLQQLNIIPGFVEPSDMRRIKCLAHKMGVKIVLFPDTSDVLDAPQSGSHQFYPSGGVTIEELSTTGDSIATLALGPVASAAAGKALTTKCQVPCTELEIPYGLAATDRFIDSMRTLAQVDVPREIDLDRGRLLDMISDMSQYLCGKKVALFGDPDQLYPLTEFLVDLGMQPVHILSGHPGKKFERSIKKLLEDKVENFQVKAAGDLFLLHQWIKNEPVDLLIGNTYGKYIARAEDIPFVRFGFPIMDRIGHSYFPNVGYQGAMRLLEKILNALLDRIDRDATEERFELVL